MPPTRRRQAAVAWAAVRDAGKAGQRRWLTRGTKDRFLKEAQRAARRLRPPLGSTPDQLARPQPGGLVASGGIVMKQQKAEASRVAALVGALRRAMATNAPLDQAAVRA